MVNFTLVNPLFRLTDASQDDTSLHERIPVRVPATRTKQYSMFLKLLRDHF